VTHGSHIKVWWKCKNAHEWEASVNKRSIGRGCPECYVIQISNIITKAAIKKSGNLKNKFPEVTKEWHPTKNKSLTPKDVSPGSHKKVWWKCKNGHEWFTEIRSRTKKESGCPECWKKIRSNVLKKAALKKSGNLKDKFPKIAKEWHPTKNKDLKPKNVTPMSQVKVWWKCKQGHKWEATIASRTWQG
jgi:protein-arginine kinase activator protein McsA